MDGKLHLMTSADVTMWSKCFAVADDTYKYTVSQKTSQFLIHCKFNMPA